jgi:SAM-dependent methyltransferase
MQKLNLGCGLRFHPEWVNIDIISASPHVQAHDLRKGIPFADATFDVVYHSHMLEHLPHRSALPFLQECHRVLKPGGIIRLATPDLEQIARTYLQALEGAMAGDATWAQNYEWIMLELLDQSVRERTGGEMGDYLINPDLPNRDFVYARIGLEGKEIVESAARARAGIEQSARPPTWQRALKQLRAAIRYPQMRERLQMYLLQRLLRLVLGKKISETVNVGFFRREGEVHQWLYDQYSLGKLLLATGYQTPKKMSADQSRIPDWPRYHLDIDPNGVVYKPDSIFMEAIKE